MSKSGDPPVTAPTELLLLKEYLFSSSKIASRLAWSHFRVRQLLPLDAARVDGLGDDEVERLDAFLYRFNSLTAMLQDHVTRALLKVEEEDISERSRKDQRQLLEKLGALKPELQFGTIAELRNRLAHLYPDDSAKQAQTLNLIFEKSRNLIEIFNDVLDYSDRKFFAAKLGLAPVVNRDASE